MFSARGARDRSGLIAIASRSGALASHSACMMAFENSITRLTPREVRASTISYCSGDNSRGIRGSQTGSGMRPGASCSTKSMSRTLAAQPQLKVMPAPLTERPIFLFVTSTLVRSNAD